MIKNYGLWRVSGTGVYIEYLYAYDMLYDKKLSDTLHFMECTGTGVHIEYWYAYGIP
jgi:hypothetical protein